MQDSPESANEIDVDPAIVPVELFSPLALLGQGALGQVYLCIDKRLGKKVAVKCLSKVTDDHVVSFQKEAKIASKLNHPSVIRILDFGIAGGGRPYMVMENFEGRSLQDTLDQSRTLSGSSSEVKNALSEPEALELFLVVCDALDYLHRNGVFHRDLKPSNILVRRNDSGAVDIRLIDFNLSKTTQDVQSKTVVQGRTVVGTPLYMSPDQIAGLTYDARSEVYSLGCVIYETLTAVPVFDGATALEILNQHVNDPIVSPLEFNPELSEKTVSTIEKCLRKDPEERFQTIEELGEQLQQAARQLSEWQEKTRSMVDAVERKQVFDDAFLKRMEKRAAPRKLRWQFAAAGIAMVAVLAVGIPIYKQLLACGESTSSDVNKKQKKTNPVGLLSPLGTAFGGPGEMTDAVLFAKRKIERGDTDISVPITATDNDLKFFADKDNVVRLSFPDSVVTDAGLVHLASMKKLNTLALDQTEVRTLATIPRIKNLHALSLRATEIDDQSLLNLKGLKLTTLRIVHTDVTDKGVSNLIGLPLKELDLSHTQVTDACADALLTFKDLKYIGLNSTKVTFQGARKIAENAHRLLRMDLQNSMMTVQEWHLLEKEFPTIKFRADWPSIFDNLSKHAHKLASEDRLVEAIAEFKECENMLKKRYGEDYQSAKDHAILRKRLENILKQRNAVNSARTSK